MAHEPLGMDFGDLVEVNYNVRLSALVRQMHLYDIHVEHGDLRSSEPNVVFTGTEYPGPAVQRQIRVVRITVKTEGFGTWETVSETTYPRAIL